MKDPKNTWIKFQEQFPQTKSVKLIHVIVGQFFESKSGHQEDSGFSWSSGLANEILERGLLHWGEFGTSRVVCLDNMICMLRPFKFPSHLSSGTRSRRADRFLSGFQGPHKRAVQISLPEGLGLTLMISAHWGRLPRAVF